MENSIFNLNAVLREKGYTDKAVTKVNQVLIDILSKGHHVNNGVIIGAKNVKPHFKINAKSIRIMLETSEVRNEIIVNHPTNSWGDPNEIVIGSHRVFKTPVFERTSREIKNLEKYTVII